VSFLVPPNQLSPYVRSPRRVSGHVTYVHTTGVVNTQREFAWVIGPQTTGFIVGTKMTDAELLRIADAIHVAPWATERSAPIAP
jgi:hypothetical protein